MASDFQSPTTMSVTDQVTQVLADNGPMSTAEMLNYLPSLAAIPEGEDVLRLLLRLNRRFTALGDGRWVLALNETSPEVRIVAATQAYFHHQGRGHELIGTLTSAVVTTTGYAEPLVRATILERFQNNAGRMVIDRVKEQS